MLSQRLHFSEVEKIAHLELAGKGLVTITSALLSQVSNLLEPR